MTSPQRAFYDEFQTLIEKERYKEVPRTSLTSEQQKTNIKTQWVVSDHPGTSDEDILKARFVAKGYVSIRHIRRLCSNSCLDIIESHVDVVHHFRLECHLLQHRISFYKHTAPGGF